MQEVRDSVQLNQINDVVLFTKSREGQFKFLVFVDAVPAEQGLAAAVEQTTEVRSQSVLDQVGKVIGCERLLALDLVSEVLLGKSCKKRVLCLVALFSIAT